MTRMNLLIGKYEPFKCTQVTVKALGLLVLSCDQILWLHSLLVGLIIIMLVTNLRYCLEDNHDWENILNTNIREEEVLAAVKQLKNNKAVGYDRVLNEHISSTVSIFLSLYTKLFNLIFDTGVIPDEWLTGIVKPIF